MLIRSFKKLLIVITAICIIVICGLVVLLFYDYKTAYYERNYFKAFGIEEDASYSEIVKIYGEPNDVKSTYYTGGINSNGNKVIHSYYALKYSDFSMILSVVDYDFVSDVSKAINDCSYTVYTDKFKFGKKSLCVGSSRDKIREVYDKYKKTKFFEDESSDKVDVYYEYPAKIYFYYDDNNCVEKIYLKQRFHWPIALYDSNETKVCPE